MSELETLQQLERETGLLASRGDVETMRQTSYQFTVKAAQRLRREGWAMLKAPAGGNQINGVRIDKLINRQTLQIVDIIVNADDPDGPPRRPDWQDVGRGNFSDVVEPPLAAEPEPGPVATPKPTEPPAVDIELDALIASAARIVESMDHVTAAVGALEQKIEQLQRDGVRLRLR